MSAHQNFIYLIIFFSLWYFSGRTFSKDSQQSSQSDLSLNIASPKVLRNVITREYTNNFISNRCLERLLPTTLISLLKMLQRRKKKKNHRKVFFMHVYLHNLTGSVNCSHSCVHGLNNGLWQGVQGRCPRFAGIQHGCRGVGGRQHSVHVLQFQTPKGPRLLYAPNGLQGP